MITVEDLHKSYWQDGVETHALQGVSFSVAQGERLAITGPSGSGKSTLLALLGALDRPSAGVLRVGDTELSRLNPAQRARYRFEKVGFVFQEFHLLAHLTVLENVLSPFLGRRRERARHWDRAMELVQAVGLAEAASRPAGVLSGGEKQRVAVARALVNDPQILLCDEPTGNLDTRNGNALMDLIESLTEANADKVLLVVTHDPNVAARFPRQVRMRDGQLVSEE